MATASHVELTPSTAGVCHAPDISSQSAKVASDLLQENHDSHHVFFNQSGFHNHIAHHILAIYALGASPQELQKAYDDNKGYQRKLKPVQQKNVEEMSDRKKFREFLGKEKYFHDYEAFFQKEIDAKGWQGVLQEQLFAGDEHAEDMLIRMYAGFYHPIIHLGYGVEFEQPAIIAEALAQAAIHDNWPKNFFEPLKEMTQSSGSSRSLVQLIQSIQNNDKLRESAHIDDENKVRDGIFKRAPSEMLHLASQWKVTPETLERKTAEMINAAVWFGGGAQHYPKQVKFDFFYMHCINCSIFFSAFIKQQWLSIEQKCRLVEMKGRFDLAMYISRGCPEIKIEEIKGYTAKKPGDGWAEIMKRMDVLPDDGHAPKLVRALANGEQVCKAYDAESDDEFPVKGDMWLKLAHMAIDSVEGQNPKWVRNCGWTESWENIAERARL